jgi:hypothetical protein
VLSTDFFLSPGWNVIYGAFNQISNLLVLPIWIVSFTLLYFDTRVRKEAYDLELLAREVSPGFYWQPVARPPAFSYYPQAGFAYPRNYVQTSPLGLAGYMPPPAPRPVVQPAQTIFPPPPAPESQQQVPVSANESAVDKATVDPAAPLCSNCGAALEAGAQFCIQCGKKVAEI